MAMYIRLLLQELSTRLSRRPYLRVKQRTLVDGHTVEF